MYRFGERSLRELATCHRDLQRLALELILHVDFSVIEGHRSRTRQRELLAAGKTTVDWGRHNVFPSRAMDLLPHPGTVEGRDIWRDPERFMYFCGFVYATAVQLGIEVRMGADWDGDFNHREHSFVDLPHVELAGSISPPSETTSA